MFKTFNKWTRTFHRWIALPTLVLIPLAVITKFTTPGEHLPPQMERFQSILMLLLAVSGAYLYTIPYWARWRRRRSRATSRTSRLTASSRRQP